MDKDIETMIAEIEARAAKATRGPWETDGFRMVMTSEPVGDDTVDVCEILHRGNGAGALGDYTAQFIAHAREDVPKLCAMWREQHKRIQDHEQWLDGLQAAWDIPNGTTIHEFMKAMALERDALRERVATLTDLLERVRDLDSLSDLPDLMRPIIKAIGENPDHRR